MEDDDDNDNQVKKERINAKSYFVVVQNFKSTEFSFKFSHGTEKFFDECVPCEYLCYAGPILMIFMSLIIWLINAFWNLNQNWLTNIVKLHFPS